MISVTDAQLSSRGDTYSKTHSEPRGRLRHRTPCETCRGNDPSAVVLTPQLEQVCCATTSRSPLKPVGEYLECCEILTRPILPPPAPVSFITPQQPSQSHGRSPQYPDRFRLGWFWSHIHQYQPISEPKQINATSSPHSFFFANWYDSQHTISLTCFLSRIICLSTKVSPSVYKQIYETANEGQESRVFNR